MDSRKISIFGPMTHEDACRIAFMLALHSLRRTRVPSIVSWAPAPYRVDEVRP